MPSIFSTALTGLLLLSNASSTGMTAQPWTKIASDEPTYVQQIYSVSMTGYNAVPEQTDDTPGFTASGLPVNAEIGAARSRDLADELPFGTVIELVPGTATSTPACELSAVEESIGLRVITDTMHPRIHNHVDILFAAYDIIHIGGRRLNSARAMGMCSNIQIRVVGHVDMKHVPDSQAELRAAIGKATFALGK
jgi:3D (Asp-Asp-Asp) domain-containing protein